VRDGADVTHSVLQGAVHVRSSADRDRHLTHAERRQHRGNWPGMELQGYRRPSGSSINREGVRGVLASFHEAEQVRGTMAPPGASDVVLSQARHGWLQLRWIEHP